MLVRPHSLPSEPSFSFGGCHQSEAFAEALPQGTLAPGRYSLRTVEVLGPAGLAISLVLIRVRLSLNSNMRLEF
jgi:hypothetical protein